MDPHRNQHQLTFFVKKVSKETFIPASRRLVSVHRFLPKYYILSLIITGFGVICLVIVFLYEVKKYDMAKPFRKLAGSVRKKVDALAVENEETKDSGSEPVQSPQPEQQAGSDNCQQDDEDWDDDDEEYEDDEEEYEDDEDIEKK